MSSLPPTFVGRSSWVGNVRQVDEERVSDRYKRSLDRTEGYDIGGDNKDNIVGVRHKVKEILTSYYS